MYQLQQCAGVTEIQFGNRCIALSTLFIFGPYITKVTVLISNYAHPTSDVDSKWIFYHVLYNLYPRDFIEL